MKLILKICFVLFAVGVYPAFKASADSLAAPFSFTFGEQNFPVSQEEFLELSGAGYLTGASPLEPPAQTPQNIVADFFGQSQSLPENSRVFSFRPEKIYALIKAAAKKIDRPAIEPVLNIENGRAKEFAAPQDGQKVNLYQSMLQAIDALEAKSVSIPLAVAQTRPQKTLAQINNLGISELVAKGESNYKGSPKNRQHNIKVGIEKFRGVIIKPGEEFSFNKNLGPVEEEAGFLPELVIKKTGTVPELGGGLCQVSTTTFRAAMLAGLPITQRKNHAYAVVYYSPQGTDATIYPGVIDLKFINDTPGHLLIWPRLEEKDKLIFEFYGSRDGRRIVIEKPTQYDKKEDGSMKAAWVRKVTKAGNVREDVFKSVYLSPALFHKEEKFISGSSAVQTIQPKSGLTIN